MHQFPCSFFLIRLKFREDFIFFALECQKIKSKGRTARTSAVVCFSGTTFSQNQSPASITINYARWRRGHYNFLFCLELSVYSTCSVLGVK